MMAALRNFWKWYWTVGTAPLTKEQEAEWQPYQM